MTWRTRAALTAALPLLFCCGPALPAAAPPGTSGDAGAYHAALLRELNENHAGLPAPAPLYGTTEAEALAGFQLLGPAADGARLTVVPVAAGQPFTRALRIDVERPRGEVWHVMAQRFNAAPVKAGDTLLLTFYVRGGVPGVGGSEAITGTGIKRIPENLDTWGGGDFRVGDRWERKSYAFRAKKDAAPGELEWISALGAQKQWVEFAGVSLLNFGPNVAPEALPREKPPTTDYAGRAPDAAWRKAAFARIEKVRKGDLSVRVVDGKGRPVPGARVSVEMTRHAFRWGTALVPSYDLGGAEPSPGGRALREKGPGLFNHFSVDIDLKFDAFYNSDAARRESDRRGMEVLTKQFGWTGRGHCMTWPSFHNMPQLKPLAGEPARLQAEILKHVADVGAFSAPYVVEWDVVNEPFGNREITGLVGGTPAMAEWFRAAKRAVPRATLYVNEAMTPGGGSPEETHLYGLCRDLLAAGVPLEGVGFQCHVGPGSMAPPEKVLAAFDRFAALKPGIALAVTEFDVNCRGDQRAEGDYTRDLLIAAFSHPSLTGFTMWGFHDPYHWLKYAPIYAEDGTLKPSGRAYVDLVRGAWWTRASGAADARGAYRVRGFLGEYRVTVTDKDGRRAQTVTASLPKGGRALTVRL